LRTKLSKSKKKRTLVGLLGKLLNSRPRLPRLSCPIQRYVPPDFITANTE
jgi:hypothetical protein